MLELPERLGLDLPNSLTCHRELQADFLKRVVPVRTEAKAHAQHALFTRGQRGEYPRGGLAQILLDRSIDWQDSVCVLDHVAKGGVPLLPDRCFERERLLGDLQGLAYPFERYAEFFGDLLRRRLATNLAEHLPPGAHDLVYGLKHVHGDADGARLIGECSADRLPDPPGGVGRELVAAPVLELVHRLHQPDVAFLNQVEKLQAAIGVFFGDRDDQPQVRLHHLLLRLARLTLALLHHVNDLAELADLEPGFAREGMYLVAVLLDRVLVPGDKALPALGRKLRHAAEPERVGVGAQIVPEEVLARDAMTLGEPHHAALVADKTLIDLVELLDQRVDPRLIQS